MAEGLGVHPEALRTWVKKAGIDAGARPGTTSQDAERIRELEKEVREQGAGLTGILRKASAHMRHGRSVSAGRGHRFIHRRATRRTLGPVPICQALTGAGTSDRPYPSCRARKSRPPSARSRRDDASRPKSAECMRRTTAYLAPARCTPC
ncbi:hypothetical protein [Actinomyces sp. CtC 72]|uniref:hypothetical protein n=1 Tax=Actinomyces ruminis TaxID=1937003 RepID=UPI0011776645